MLFADVSTRTPTTPGGLRVRADELERLPPLPQPRSCSCGGPLRWSHLDYVGGGRSLAIYTCAVCGSAYRGAPGQRQNQPGPRRQRPMPDEGHPHNPVLDPALAEQLRQALSDD
jgi:hypothetical protein